jgi:hypothetical protein
LILDKIIIDREGQVKKERERQRPDRTTKNKLSVTGDSYHGATLPKEGLTDVRENNCCNIEKFVSVDWNGSVVEVE